MLKVTNRGLTEGLINTMVKDGNVIYTIFAERNEENGKYNIFVKKNKKVFVIRKEVGTSVKFVNKKIMEITSFYNLGNNVKRLAEIAKSEVEKEKIYRKNVKIREDKIKKEIRNKMKTRKSRSNPMSKDLKGIIMSMSAVK